jgi:sulfite reductase (NADPH) hemoprotein beta-component
VVGPAFGAQEVPGVIEAVLDTYRQHRVGRETFIDALKRVGFDTFKAAANSARLSDKHEDLHTLPKSTDFAKDAQEA